MMMMMIILMIYLLSTKIVAKLYIYIYIYIYHLLYEIRPKIFLIYNLNVKKTTDFFVFLNYLLLFIKYL